MVDVEDISRIKMGKQRKAANQRRKCLMQIEQRQWSRKAPLRSPRNRSSCFYSLSFDFYDSFYGDFRVSLMSLDPKQTPIATLHCWITFEELLGFIDTELRPIQICHVDCWIRWWSWSMESMAAGFTSILSSYVSLTITNVDQVKRIVWFA